jgi:hypothetical protein
MLLSFSVRRNWVLLTLASACGLSLLLGSCRNPMSDGRTFKVDYTWDSKVRLIRVINNTSGKDVNDPAVRAKISEVADQQLPPWIALSKFKVAEGTFHIQFRGQDTNILETEHGMEGTGPNFIKDPKVTELMILAHEGRLDSLRDNLINKRENVNAVDQLGNTAVMAAVSSGRVEVLRLLMDHGANTNARNADGETALTFSIFSRQPDMANELISHGAIFDCKNATDRATFEGAKRRRLGNLLSLLSKVAVNCD